MTENKKPAMTTNNQHTGMQDLSRTTTYTGNLSAAPKLETEYITGSKKQNKSHK